MEYKETAYSHIAGDDFMEITACERWAITMIQKLKERFPDEVNITAENPDGSMVATLPFKWMRIVPKRKRDLTDEQRQELSERMKGLRESQLNTQKNNSNLNDKGEQV